MIAYKTWVAQLSVLFRLNDLLQGLGQKKYVSFLDSMIVNDLKKDSFAHKCVLFGLYDRQ